MAVSYYLPSSDKGKVIWGKTLMSKFAPLATTLGFTAQELTALQNDMAFYIYSVESAEFFKTELKERTTYRNVLRDGPIGAPLGAYPSVPSLPAPPTAVPAGVIPRLTAAIRRIKAHSNYTESMGKDLGIIGSEINSDFVDLKPVLTIYKTGGNVIIKYKKQNTDGIQLYCRRGDEKDFTLLAVVTKTEYKDTRENLIPGQAETRQYRAWYIKNDDIIGQQSDDTSFVV